MRAVGDGRWGRPLACGPFTGERYQGSWRWLRIGEQECIRMVGIVVRDRAWRTLLPAELRERAGHGGWTVRGRTPVGDATLVWRLAIEARPGGIDVRATMTAEGDVVTNRAGIVVLLPAATFAGGAFAARHADGGRTRGRLPREIAPHQPMVDLSGVRVAARGGPTLNLSFAGEVFEMEDQRNWLDPSFKLYSRSLSRPVPYRIRDGLCVEQRLTIDVMRGARRTRPVRRSPRRGVLPAIGIATAADRVPEDARVVERLREISPAFLLHRADRRARGLTAAARLAASLDVPLRVEAFGASRVLADAIARARPQCVAPYFSGPAVARVLARRGVPVVGGTFSDFAMLNHNGVVPRAKRVAFGLCPTVHARDDRSLIESLETLATACEQARHIARGRPLDAGPCSLLRRLVPGTGEPATRGPRPGDDDYDLDPRQHEPIAAAWLACVIAVAAVSGVSSVCTFEAEGARGLVRSPRRSPSHAVLAALAGRAGTGVTLLALNVRRGAALVLEGDPAELWRVDLSGQRRECPPYGIVRLARAGMRAREVAALAHAWCDEARS